MTKLATERSVVWINPGAMCRAASAAGVAGAARA